MVLLTRCVVGLSLFLMLVLSTSVNAQETFKLRLGHNNAVNHPVNLGAQRLAELASEKSDGRLEIQIFPAAQLGDERELGEAIQVGTVDMAWAVPSFFGEYLPEIGGLEGGYLWHSREHMENVTRGEVGLEISQKLVDAIGVRVLAWHFAGQRHLTTTNKRIQKPADLAGMKIRAPRLESYMVTMGSMGAEVTPIAFQEVYLALRQGVAEGQENPIPSIHAMKFYEVQNYLMLTGHMTGIGLFAINERVLGQLPGELQEVLVEAANQAAIFTGDVYEEQSEELLPILEEHMTVVEPDVEAFRDYALENGMRDWLIGKLGQDLFDRIQSY